MCDPISLTIGSLVIGAAGTAYSAYSQIQAGKAQQAAYAQQARLQQEKARYDQALVTNRYDKMSGEQRARIAASGLSAGSFSDVLADSAIDAALQKKAIKFGADAESSNLLAQGENAAFNAKSGAVGTIFSGIGQTLSGAAKMSNMTSVSSPWQTTVNYSDGRAPFTL